MIYHPEIFRHSPAYAVAGGIVPIIQFAANKLALQHSAHRKHQLRKKVIALNAFIVSMKEVPDKNDSYATCLQDAILERSRVLNQLAALTPEESRRSAQFFSKNAAQQLFLLYAPPRPIGWLLRWAFFTLLIYTVTGTVRGLLHINYLPAHVLLPTLIVNSILVVLVRLAAYYLEPMKPEKHMHTASAS